MKPRSPKIKDPRRCRNADKQWEDNSMLDNLTFSQRRVHTVGVGVLLSAVMLCATPVFAQELRHVAEVLKKTGGGPPSFGDRKSVV